MGNNKLSPRNEKPVSGHQIEVTDFIPSSNEKNIRLDFFNCENRVRLSIGDVMHIQLRRLLASEAASVS
jgi:hypothetical protein